MIFRLTTYLCLALVFFAQTICCGQSKNNNMSQAAQDYIASFKKGQDFQAPAKGVYINGQPDPSALETLGKALAEEDPNVRENIVFLLVEMGKSTDPLTPRGAETLRNQRIIEILANAGLAKPDLGREAAMEALRKLCTRKGLAGFDDQFTNALALEPTEEAFLLVAKAKPQKAKELIERLIKLPRWENLESAKIAQAALGDTEEENRFLEAAKQAKDGESLAVAVGPLALMGTEKAIRFIAENLRSPLVIEISGHMPGKSVKSVRLNILDALLYNFPDRPELYPNNIHDDEGYRAAERFCMDTLGVVYRNEAPPFLKFGNIPPIN